MGGQLHLSRNQCQHILCCCKSKMSSGLRRSFCSPPVVFVSFKSYCCFHALSSCLLVLARSTPRLQCQCYLFCCSVLWYFVYIDRCFGVLENLLFGHKCGKKRVVDGLCWFCVDFWFLMLCSRHTIVQVVSCRQSTVVCYPWDGRLFRLSFFLH